MKTNGYSRKGGSTNQDEATDTLADVFFIPDMVCVTTRVERTVTPAEICKGLRRHFRGDWGNLCDHDRAENERAMRRCGPLVSVYRTGNGTRFWIITDEGWSTTTVFLPDD